MGVYPDGGPGNWDNSGILVLAGFPSGKFSHRIRVGKDFQNMLRYILLDVYLRDGIRRTAEQLRWEK